MKRRDPVTVWVGNVPINTFGASYQTIPRPQLLKLLGLGGQVVTVRCTGIYTDDYLFDAAYDFQRGDVDPLTLAAEMKDSTSLRGYHNGRGAISFGRHQNEHYELRPAVGTIRVEPR